MKLSIFGLLVAVSLLHVTHGYGHGQGAVASPVFHVPALFAPNNHLPFLSHHFPVFHGVPSLPKTGPFPFPGGGVPGGFHAGFPGVFAGAFPSSFSGAHTGASAPASSLPRMDPFPFPRGGIRQPFGFPGAFAGAFSSSLTRGVSQTGQRRLGTFVVPGSGRTIFTNVGEKDFDDFFDYDDDKEFFDFDDDFFGHD
ncbi:hypothetical protein BaRGS_00004060 [Batillaria attramentaria]|uniref:Uncharacterized protein n=1 Tax=Batillaria attramentaria TaxID=370345 RepID=A0ABD0LY16_9CAEN